MKIKETIERECCNPTTDLFPYKGEILSALGLYSFCKYCGQIWVLKRVTSASGDREDILIKYVVG